MATVTGYTAARMKSIEDNAVVDGSVDGSGHLILEKHNGTTIDAGSVIGPIGPTGPTGPVEEAPNNANYYVRKGAAWERQQDAIADLIWKQQVVPSGSTVTTVELTWATMTLNAPVADSKLDVSCYLTAFTSVAGDRFNFRILVDGTQKGEINLTAGFVGPVQVCIPNITLVDVLTGQTPVILLKVQRISGTGSISFDASADGIMTASITPS